MRGKPGIRDKAGAVTAADFRIVEHPAARILIGEKGLPDGAANARPNSGLVRWVEPWIEPQHRIKSNGEGILSQLIPLLGRKPSRQSRNDLTPFRRQISPLPYPPAICRPN